MTDTKPETWALDDMPDSWLRPAPPRQCDVCRAWLFPGDWLTRDGCCWCDRDEVLL